MSCYSEREKQLSLKRIRREKDFVIISMECQIDRTTQVLKGAPNRGNLHFMFTRVENECNPCKNLARFLHFTYSFEDLARKCYPCKYPTRKCNSCKILQGNPFLARSCKEIESLQESCKIF